MPRTPGRDRRFPRKPRSSRAFSWRVRARPRASPLRRAHGAEHRAKNGHLVDRSTNPVATSPRMKNGAIFGRSPRLHASVRWLRLRGSSKSGDGVLRSLRKRALAARSGESSVYERERASLRGRTAPQSAVSAGKSKAAPRGKNITAGTRTNDPCTFQPSRPGTRPTCRGKRP